MTHLMIVGLISISLVMLDECYAIDPLENAVYAAADFDTRCPLLDGHYKFAGVSKPSGDKGAVDYLHASTILNAFTYPSMVVQRDIQSRMKRDEKNRYIFPDTFQLKTIPGKLVLVTTYYADTGKIGEWSYDLSPIRDGCRGGVLTYAFSDDRSLDVGGDKTESRLWLWKDEYGALMFESRFNVEKRSFFLPMGTVKYINVTRFESID
ncbi:hypothetical protein [Amantichitinum ursilacus]|uniref:Uncharacterized protein n=1 Tax=Amantichitinum ursilacus TaxID=857265 RepID=A0A0N0XIN5_9NEIS|nr:hypothetical protein [Amantichitinum ursilacus]KPC52547.1 hypothetical protein WG78_11905 [Amantichitinum ursilacus]